MRLAARTILLMAVSTLYLFAVEPISSMAGIKQQYKYINAHLKDFTTQQREIHGISTEGAMATSYVDTLGMVRLVKLHIFSEMGKTERDYYFHNNRLFFLYQIDYRYNAPMYAASYFDPKKTEITHSRFYFIDHKLVRWIDEKSNTISPINPDFSKKEQQILSFVSRYIHSASQKERPASLLWNKTLKQAGNMLKTVPTGDNGYLLVTHTASSDEENTLLFSKFSQEGLQQWHYSFKKTGYSHLHAIIENPNGSFTACVESSSEGSAIAWLLTLQTDGRIAWEKATEKVDAGTIDIDNCFAAKPDGYIITGDSTLSGSGESYFWIKRLDGKGDSTWERHYSKYPQDATLKVIATRDGGFLAIGLRDDHGATHIWAMKMDRSGKKVWEKYLGEADPSDKIRVMEKKDHTIMILQERAQDNTATPDIRMIAIKN